MKKSAKKLRRALSLMMTAVLALSLALISYGTPAFADSPALSSGRERLNFNQGWKFVRKNIAEAALVDYPLSELERWDSVDLPHTVREDPLINSGGINYQGYAMYRKHFILDESYAEKKLFVEFEGIMGVTDIWINGAHMQTPIAALTGSADGDHTYYGGYLPIVLDITDAVHCDGAYNVITVLANNADNSLVPPGKTQSTLDFTYFGGIYRNAWLDAVSPVHITNANYENIVAGGGVLVDFPAVSQASADVYAKTHVRNESESAQTVSLVTDVIDQDGRTVGTLASSQSIAAGAAYSFEQTIAVANPHLWNLDDPYMHKLVSKVSVGGVEAERLTTPIGIRKIEFSATEGVLINGVNPGFLSGVNRHQEYAYIGFAASSSLQRRDAIKYKSAGFSIVRTAHHSQSADFLDACDELGILVMEATPGWQYWNSDATFGSRVKLDIRQMIRRDRNHPCILSFEISLNETGGLAAFTNECDAVAKSEGPSIRTSAENHNASAVSDILYDDLSTVSGYNNYSLAQTREYGDNYLEQYGGRTTLARVTRGPGTAYPGGEAAMLVQANRRLWDSGSVGTMSEYKYTYDSNPRYIGSTMWIGIDHNRGYDPTMSPCGVWDLMRIPKYSYYAFASQRPAEADSYLESKGVETGPVLFIASSWGAAAPSVQWGTLNSGAGAMTIGTDAQRQIYVYSNAEAVRLTVKSADGAALWTDTQSPISDKRASSLDHAPFRFNSVPYAAGSYLAAEGLDSDGGVIASSEQHAAGAPAKLRVEVDQSGASFIADGSDCVMVYAYVLDADGNVCSEATNELSFSVVSGDASVVGDGSQRTRSNPANAEAGVMGAFIRSGKTAGEITVRVESAGLSPAETTFSSVGLETPVVPYVAIADSDEPFATGAAALSDYGGVALGANAHSFAKGDVTLGGVTYEDSLTVSNMSAVRFRLDGVCSQLAGQAALASPSNYKDGAVFKIYLDGVLRWVSGRVTDGIASYDIDVSGAQEVTLVGEDENGVHTSDVVWLSPYVIEGALPVDESELFENVAVGGSASASSSDAGTSAADAADGNMATLWRSGEDVTEGSPQTWQIDLGSAKNIRGARLGFESDNTTYGYSIYASADSQSWDKVYSGAKSGQANAQADQFVASGVQYIKVEFTSADSTAGQTKRASLLEFEAFLDKGVATVRDYNLFGLEIGNKNMAFDPKITAYAITATGDEADFYIKAVPANKDSSVRINGAPVTPGLTMETTGYALASPDENGQIAVAVTSPDGLGTKTYTITALPAENPNLFQTYAGFVPGINGANHWHYQYQSRASGAFADMGGSSAYIQGEQAWMAGDWLYAGPRYFHPGTDRNAVRAFQAPKSGTYEINLEMSKTNSGNAGQVAIRVMKNGERVWPAADQMLSSYTASVKASFTVAAAKDDMIQIVVDNYNGNGNDATCIVSSAELVDESEPPDETNIFLHKAAKASSEDTAQGSTADKAVDGLRGGKPEKWCGLGASASPWPGYYPAYWMVDLGDTYDIESIHIDFEDFDKSAKDPFSYAIYVSNSPDVWAGTPTPADPSQGVDIGAWKESEIVVDHRANNAELNLDRDFTINEVGRYVMVYFSERPNTGTNYWPCIVEITGVGERVPDNIFLGKQARASHTQDSSHLPAFAADGSTSTYWCGIGRGEAEGWLGYYPAWIMFDLGANYDIESMDLTMESASTAFNYRVYVTDNPLAWSETPIPSQPDAPIDISLWKDSEIIVDYSDNDSEQSLAHAFAVNRTGRYVMVYYPQRPNTSKNWWPSLVEISGKGRPAEVKTDAIDNVFLNKPARASHTQDSSHIPEFAVDGSTSAYWCGLGRGEAENWLGYYPAWIMFDLGDSYDIESIKLAMEDQSVAFNFRIYLTDNPLAWSETPIPSTPAGPIDISQWKDSEIIVDRSDNNTAQNLDREFAVNRSGRYVMVYYTERPNTSKNWWASLVEISGAASRPDPEAPVTDGISLDPSFVVEPNFIPEQDSALFNPRFKVTSVAGQTASLITAAYDSDGRLIAVNRNSLTLGKGQEGYLQAPMARADSAVLYKYFLWDARNKPLIESTIPE
ncbi:MAG: discoidin domain-containing protein [Oscillospiraceae bacterium]|jgi:hypothetical protein|nr:discoidin domain-containing protein [Oscillospiraceae bacterium]